MEGAALFIMLLPLDHQHGIAIAEETVFVFDRFFVRFHRQVIAGKGADHDQEAGFGQVQVGDQGIGNIEIVRRMDERIGPAFGRFQ